MCNMKRDHGIYVYIRITKSSEIELTLTKTLYTLWSRGCKNSDV